MTNSVSRYQPKTCDYQKIRIIEIPLYTSSRPTFAPNSQPDASSSDAKPYPRCHVGRALHSFDYAWRSPAAAGYVTKPTPNWVEVEAQRVYQGPGNNPSLSRRAGPRRHAGFRGRFGCISSGIGVDSMRQRGSRRARFLNRESGAASEPRVYYITLETFVLAIDNYPSL